MLDFKDVLATIGQRRCHLLLGNGFSIACDSVFRYDNLYQTALKAGLSSRAMKVFDYLGTNNFEGVLRLLDDAVLVGELYDAPETCSKLMREDFEIVKAALVNAVAHSHLEHSGLVDQNRKAKALSFLANFHNVFTTNYDLLAYWVSMSNEGQPLFQDGFRAPTDPDEPYVVFTERLGKARGLFYLHGALHFYVQDGELRKHTWCRTGTRLTDQIRGGLEEKRYPLFVAEGAPERKLEQIQRHGYLWYALDKLARIEGPLVVYGHSLGPSDSHIVNTLAYNCDLPEIYIGSYGHDAAVAEIAEKLPYLRQEALDRRRGKGLQLKVSLFDSRSAPVWG